MFLIALELYTADSMCRNTSLGSQTAEQLEPNDAQGDPSTIASDAALLEELVAQAGLTDRIVDPEEPILPVGTVPGTSPSQEKLTCPHAEKVVYWKKIQDEVRASSSVCSRGEPTQRIIAGFRVGASGNSGKAVVCDLRARPRRME
jgi:hypothetical protein